MRKMLLGLLLSSLVLMLTGFSGQAAPGTLEIVVNGVHVRILSSQRSENTFSGELAVTDSGTIHRLLRNKQNGVEFGYDIVATPVSGHREVKVRIMPLDPQSLTLFRGQSVSSAGGTEVEPGTFKEGRELGPLSAGARVSFDLFTDRETGQTVKDTIEIEEVAPVRPQIDFTLADVHVSLNGHEITAGSRLQSISGNYPVLYVPGQGSFFLSLESHNDAPFSRAGIVDGNKLRFAIDGQSIECASRLPILRNSGPAELWVWHAPKYKPSIPTIEAFIGPSSANAFQVAVADSLDVWRSLVMR